MRHAAKDLTLAVNNRIFLLFSSAISGQRKNKENNSRGAFQKRDVQQKT
jgi:hypothetical protein